jgi:hypothetical protein
MFRTLNGRERDVSIKRYLIDWSPEREVSSFQRDTKRFLYPYWRHDIVLEEFRIPGAGLLRVDLLNVVKGIMVEVSPESSHSYNAFFHRGSMNVFKDALKRDLAKAKWAEANGFQYVEIIGSDFPLSQAVFERQGVTL